MIITIKEIQNQFNYWNNKVFNNELPVPQFELMQTKHLLGQFCPRKIMGQYTYKIRISVFYDRPLESYIDTIVHEMLHYYIKYKGIKDTSSHGRVWKQYAANISRKYGLTITRTNPANGGATEAVKAKKEGKMEYVFLCKMKSGRYAAAVIPPGKFGYFNTSFRNWSSVVDLKAVKAPWNETYRLNHLRTATSVRHISEEQYNNLLTHKRVEIL